MTSDDLPAACSGAMYDGVPMIAPETVNPASSFDPLGQAEVGHVGVALAIQKDIRGLQVAVQDSPLMGVVDRVGDLGDHAGGRPGVFRECVQLFIQSLSVD